MTTVTAAPCLRLWTREEYHQMAEVGVLKPDEKTELIQGRIFSRMSPQRTPHTVALRATVQMLIDAFGPGHEVRYQLPLILPDGSEPEPDVIVLPGSFRDYEDRQPQVSDVLLLVEVSDSTLAFDTGHKASVYAEAGIDDYWILDLRKRSLAAYRLPSPAGYKSVTLYDESDSVTPLAAPGASIQVAEMLPRLKG